MYNGESYMISLGEYPIVTLSGARDMCIQKRQEILNGRYNKSPDEIISFESVANVLFDRQEAMSKASERSRYNERNRAIKYIYPTIGKAHMPSITPIMLKDR